MDEVKDMTAPKDGVKTSKTILYKVTVDCYWDGILWHKDDRVELPADVKPLEYFVKVAD